MTFLLPLPGVCSLGIDAKTNKKVRHIERKRNIPPKKYRVYTLHFSRGILHYVQNDVFFYPSREIAAVATLAKTVKTNLASSFGGSGTKCR